MPRGDAVDCAVKAQAVSPLSFGDRQQTYATDIAGDDHVWRR